jgi:cysteine synthase
VPEGVSQERRLIIESYGGGVVFTPRAEGIRGALKGAEREAAERQGFPVGPSSGLNFRAALLAAERLGPDAHIVTVFPDRMERYFSTELFA